MLSSRKIEINSIMTFMERWNRSIPIEAPDSHFLSHL